MHLAPSRRGRSCRPASKLGAPISQGLALPPEMPHLGVRIGWRGQLPHLLPEPGPGFKIFVEGREEVGERRS